ncbi:hypothetical protein V5P93_002022 [Actinokineospora auranticolor]|uniref:Uncharacterized protein n=1 Tax=Actinokineospora auranticolor TaxID=155976 RepID=A0A2S6GCL2_9PSEU|nr:hypothetical protein [Actinokineospora auranticolor]PPK62588.1 hypothetical protein CLV40_13450 [Actinokineospora auranticolor]
MGVPSPQEVAAWVRLELLSTETLPMTAAHWLVDGYDGEALRTLAGLGTRDLHDIREVLPAALADCGVSIPESVTEAAHLDFVRIARAFQAGEFSVAAVLSQVVPVTDFCGDPGHPLRGLPMSRLDEYTYGYWGEAWEPTEAELAAAVREACAEELALDYPRGVGE